MKVLWLASWYPNQITPFDGDFIQRHARASALYNQIHVIHVIEDPSGKLKSSYKVEEQQQGNLKETIIYFKTRCNKGFLHKLESNYYYLKYNKLAINLYIKQYGKPDLIHVHVPLKAGLSALWALKKFAVPFVVTEHWAIYNNMAPDSYLQRNFLFKYFAKRVIRKSRILLPVSKDLGERINHYVIKKECEVIPNVVDVDRFNYNQAPDLVKFRFLHVSAMKSSQKNPEGILNAVIKLAKQRDDFEFYFVGPHTQTFEDSCAESGLLNKVIFLKGEISYMEVAEEMKKASVFVLFSRYENLPCVVLEALCSGLPVIATGVGGIPEVINSSNGMLVEEDNENELYLAMNNIMENHKIFNRAKIAEEAIVKFNYKIVGKQFDIIYQKVLDLKA
ncbi:MAG: glycosyltransferase [Sphingobacteriales bacterium]